MRYFRTAAACSTIFLVLLMSREALSQETQQEATQKLYFDAKLGLTFWSGNGSTSGLLFGGGLDIPVDKNLYGRPELNITTLSGTPIELAAALKYMIPNTLAATPLYVEGGPGLWFSSGGTSFTLDFGGGAIFALKGSNLSIPAEVKFGPIFASGSTIFQITLSSGIRFAIP